MGPIEAIKLVGLWRKFQAVTKEKASMQVKVPQLLTLFVSLSATIGLPTLVTNFVHAHAVVYMAIVAAALVLHAVMPSVFAAPSAADQQATGLNKLGALLLVVGLMLMVPARVKAQTTEAPADLQQIFAGGVSYSVNASPGIAGTGLYAHLVDSSGTYAFTVVDALPNTVKPFTVTTNFGVGVAQKVYTFGKVPIYVPAAAGFSWSGSNTGWQWNGGALASIHIKGNYYVMPTVRFLKSSVSNGSGYQPIIGLLFGWGQ